MSYVDRYGIKYVKEYKTNNYNETKKEVNNWKNLIIRERGCYKIDYIAKFISVNKCPGIKGDKLQSCGGFRFQQYPNANCRGKETCWENKKGVVYGIVLLRRSREILYCNNCGKAFIKTKYIRCKGSGLFCTETCRFKCNTRKMCNQCKSLVRLEEVKYTDIQSKIITESRENYDNFKYLNLTDNIEFCSKDCINLFKKTYI